MCYGKSVPFITDTFELLPSSLDVIIRTLLKKPPRCKEREERFETFTQTGYHGNHLVII